MTLYILKQQYEQIKSSSLSQESFLETKQTLKYHFYFYIFSYEMIQYRLHGYVIVLL